MNRTTPSLIALPPTLSMDEYSDYIESSLQESNPASTARQKAIEERILAPFRLPGRTDFRKSIKLQVSAA
jgi:hypothetical protein